LMHKVVFSYFSARVNSVTVPFDKMAASTIMLKGTTHTTASSSLGCAWDEKKLFLPPFSHSGELDQVRTTGTMVL
jgi:hypothetical protein